VQFLSSARVQMAAQERPDFARFRAKKLCQNLHIVTLPSQPLFQPVNVLGEHIFDHIRADRFLADLVRFLEGARLSLIGRVLTASIVLRALSSRCARSSASLEMHERLACAGERSIIRENVGGSARKEPRNPSARSPTRRHFPYPVDRMLPSSKSTASRICYRSLLVMQASLAGFWVPWYDILLFFLRVGLTKIWELGTDPIAIRGSAVLEGHV
jgi:hypothetical protein